MIRSGLILALALATVVPVRADEKSLHQTARDFYDAGEYHGAITEILRFRFLYPGSSDAPGLCFLMGMAYYRGDNYGKALDALGGCYGEYPATQAGEQALFATGLLRLRDGAPFYAVRSFQEYRYVYPRGEWTEAARYYTAVATALTPNLEVALRDIRGYRESYPGGTYDDEARSLEALVNAERERPKKSLLLSGIGSMIVPGFGYFYGGDPRTGAMSLVTNLVCWSLVYDGYRRGNRAQMLIMAPVGLSFYLHGIYGGIRTVNEYNGPREYYRGVRLLVTTPF